MHIWCNPLPLLCLSHWHVAHTTRHQPNFWFFFFYGRFSCFATYALKSDRLYEPYISIAICLKSKYDIALTFRGRKTKTTCWFLLTSTSNHQLTWSSFIRSVCSWPVGITLSTHKHFNYSNKKRSNSLISMQKRSKLTHKHLAITILYNYLALTILFCLQ